ncbi:MAG: TM0106 family RecB-like putative nuclease [Legionellales bacterium]|nr:TM0106 family RecB-like putative nuclease [Legionellales bacterium]
MNYFKYSPTDLTLFMRSPFASWMNRFVLEFPEKAPERDSDDELMEVLQNKGFQHEKAQEELLKSQGLSVQKIEADTIDLKKQAMLDAMKNGSDVIVQAYLENKQFFGYADFLVKVPGESKFGNFHYEVWDTKLSHKAKPEFIIQLCCYAEMLEAIQNRRPDNISIVLGNGENEKLKVDDYFYYYLSLKEIFLLSQEQFDCRNTPDPADSKDWGCWSSYAEKLLTERDHLFQVANITKGQIKKLNKADIQTTQQLVNTNLNKRIPGINPAILERLKTQAAIQKESIGEDRPRYKIITPAPDEKLGLALLPPHSPLDVFFDIEGYPLEEGGLEYLWGCAYFDEQGERCFKDFWAHDREQEKQAFKQFIEWVYERWQRDPTMHIYHYANYEIAACRKLMGRYGICEHELDQLLRNEVFVDLYKIVKSSLLLGEPKYSIKNVEHLYRGKRETDIGTGGDSVVVYERWRDLFANGVDTNHWESSDILKSIRDYNIDDCNSTQELVAWLRGQQQANDIVYLGKTEVVEPELKVDVTQRIELRYRLISSATQAFSEDPKRATLTENLAWMLEFHRRELKPLFWRLFDRLGLSEEELFDDLDCLAFCRRTGREPFKPTPRARNLAYEYQFDVDQEFKGATDYFYLLGLEDENKKSIKVKFCVEASDLEHGLICLQSKNEPPSVVTLIPDEYVNPEPIPQAIYQLVADYESDKLDHCAILDFLNRAKPRIKNHHGGAIAPAQDPKEKLQQIIHAVKHLDNSYLPIQGPPGAGKTYTAKHVIAELIKIGAKVGIASNSHKAINHLLLKTKEYCSENNISGMFACTKDTDPNLRTENIAILKNNELAHHVTTSCVIGTTAWGYARDDMANQLDYLFVDEAGQVSVANLVAMSRSAKNLVIMGDQMQLGQPSQGTHPAESGLSILDYLLHETPTISDEMGVFLGTTYRMHSTINQFISRFIYDSKLESHPDNDRRVVKVPVGYQGKLNKEAGILFVPVEHEGNTYASDEEVSEIKSLATDLIGRTFCEASGKTRLIAWDDILFVAPYNYQVNKLKQALGEQARVGSVDKFQGREAPIVFLSMCASDANESPRGIDFLFDKHRINVAISRAQSLAIVVANPQIKSTSASKIEQLKLINLFNALCCEGS